MKICRETRRLMERAFDRRITVDEEFRLEEHTQVCPKCAREYEESCALADALLALPAPPVERLDIDRSLAAIHAGIEDREALPIAPPRPWSSLAAAAAVLVAIGFGMWKLSRPTETVPVIARPVVRVDAEPEAEPALAAAVLDLTDYDRARHQVSLQTVREVLVRAAGSGTATSDIDAWTEELAASGWPVVRLVERFVLDEDVAVASTATHYLGLRGDGASVAVLTQALQRPALGVGAARALVDLGALGVDSLASAVWNPKLTAIVLDGVRRQDQRVSAAWIESTLMRARSRAASVSDMEVAAELLGLLSHCDAPGADALLRLAEHPWAGTERVLDALALTSGAAEIVDREWLADRTSVSTEVLLGATLRLHGPDSLDPVVELCRRSRRYRSRAFEVLATYDGVGPVQSMLALGMSARMPEEEFLPAWHAAIDHNSDRMYQLAGMWPEGGNGQAARNFLHWLVVSERFDVAPAILELLRSPLLLADDRERALLALAEFGGAEHVAGVGELLASLRGRDSKIAAACLYAAHVLGGEDAVTRLLSEASTRTLDDVRRVLSQPGAVRRPGTTLFRLARELEPMLHARDNALSRTSS